MEGLEVELTGDLRKLDLPTKSRIDLLRRIFKHTGYFIGSNSWMVNLPLKIPFVEYKHGEVDLGTLISSNNFFVQIETRKESRYMTKKLLGYQIC